MVNDSIGTQRTKEMGEGLQNRVVAVITVRWNSTRFPGKALADLNGRPLLQHLVDGVRKAKYLDDYIVATSCQSQPIIDYCQENSIPHCEHCDEDNILGRLYEAASYTKADIIVRLWGDAPILCPAEIDLAVIDACEQKADYYFTQNGRTGVGIAVMPFSVLEDKEDSVSDSNNREWFHKYMLTQENVVIRDNDGNDKFSLLIDTPEDLDRIKQCLGISL